MASVFPPPVTAVQVGNFFVGQYYQVLQGNPDLVHQFYTDASNMTLIDGSLIESATAMLEIHSLIMSLNFKTIEIKTAHSMESWNGGVLVVVQGFVHKEPNDKRGFVQTFFLAPQEKGYFVLNDVFQFIDEEQVQQHPTAVLEHEQYNPELNAVNPVPEPVTDYVLGEGIQDEDFAPEMHAEVTEAVDKYSIPEPQQPVSEPEDIVEEEVQVEEPPASYPSSMSIVHDPLPVLIEQPIEEPIKHTYASILRTSKAHPRPSVPQQSSAKNVPVTSEWDDIPQPAPVQLSYPLQPVVSEKSNMEAVEEFPAFDDEGEVTSVYVRNLPSTASAYELEQEFKNFGRIKPDGVLIKSRKEVGVYYAFVEFEDISGVHNAVKASPIQYQGRQIHVEERRPNAGSSRGRRGRGRGGYQQEGSRGGRFGGRSYGRGIGQDNTIRDYTGKSRGNGFVQRGSSRQERGILGPQGLRNGHPSDFAS